MGIPLIDFVPGDDTGLSIPAHGKALMHGGAALLTEAFRQFGALAPGNSVARITRWERCPGGSTGEKFFLSVEYADPKPHLHTELFVKFSRDFDDQERDDRGKYEMESEVRLAALARLASFPIHVPTPYFADFNSASKTGVLITQKIAFGEGGVDAHCMKCLDHELDDALPRYQTIVSALARLAAAHKSKRLSPDIEARFPYDRDAAAAAAPIGYDVAQMQTMVREYADFAARAPQLLPAAVRTPEFIAALQRDTRRLLEHEAAIKRFLQSDADLIALCHWNAQIDNAWFWRAPDGSLQCGLMDWGHVGQMNVAFSLWGCLAGAEQWIWDRHLDQLLRLFRDEYAAGGGPSLDVERLKQHVLLYMAIMGVSYFMASPQRILMRMPEALHLSGPHDPKFRSNDPARNNLHILSLFLSIWRNENVSRRLDEFLAQDARR